MSINLLCSFFSLATAPAVTPTTTPGAYDVTLEGTKRDAFVVKVSQASTQGQQTRVIHYTYDPLNRLTAADYDDGTYFHISLKETRILSRGVSIRDSTSNGRTPHD